MHTVLIRPAEYDSVAGAVDEVFDRFAPPVAGKKVLIKPNVLRASTAAEGIVTNPAVLSAVVKKVASLSPAELIVGDNPGLFNYGDNERSFESTGLMEAAGGYYRNIGNESVKMDFNPDYMASVSLSKAVADADVIISLPKFKTHGLTVMTGAIKNSYGILPGAQKARLHKAAGSPERFHELVVDVFRLRVPDLFIVDAVTGMMGNGPASPDLIHIGKIMASDNAVALDAVIASMMGLDPAKLRFLQKAAEAGLGTYDLKQIDIRGDATPVEGFVVPPLGGEALMDNPAIQQMMNEKVDVKPKADPDLCTGCGVCVEQCPVSALSIPDDVPQVDADTCITCFCCQEACPEKAMALA